MVLSFILEIKFPFFFYDDVFQYGILQTPTVSTVSQPVDRRRCSTEGIRMETATFKDIVREILQRPLPILSQNTVLG